MGWTVATDRTCFVLYWRILLIFHFLVKARFFYNDVFQLPLPQKHRFPIDKYRLVREKLQRELRLIEPLEFFSPLFPHH